MRSIVMSMSVGMSVSHVSKMTMAKLYQIFVHVDCGHGFNSSSFIVL